MIFQPEGKNKIMMLFGKGYILSNVQWNKDGECAKIAFANSTKPCVIDENVVHDDTFKTLVEMTFTNKESVDVIIKQLNRLKTKLK